MERSRNRLKLDKYNCVYLSLSVHQLVKLCSGMIEAGRVYISANKLFVSGIRDLSHHCKKEEMISECLEKCGESLQEIVNYHMVRHMSLRLALHGHMDVRKFKETKKQFDKVREDMEIAQVKNAQAPRSKLHEVEEATSTLITTRKCFRHLALDYVLQVFQNKSDSSPKNDNSMLSFMQAQHSLFQQGFNLLDEIDPYMKNLAAELDQLVIDSAMEKREMEHKHATIQQAALFLGYLFKRASNAFKTWNRRWFSIQNSQLVYQKRLKDALTVVVEDLRLCSVKPCEDIERRFCFEVVSPTKSCMLQAESEKLRQAWIQAVQASIASAYREISENYYIERLDRTASPSTSSIDSASEPRERIVKGESILQRVQSLPGNEICCDCGQADPRWASINLGILLCIECSGIHRSLGVHCSKVRSLTLDTWEPELMKLMCEIGNTVINQIYEGACEEQRLKKPGPSSSRQEKEAWIKAKYVERKFLKKMCGSEALVEGSRKSHHWSVKKCRRHNSSIRAPKTRRKYRHNAGIMSPANLSAGTCLFRRESLFCPDELDSLFSYFDTGSGPRSLSSDSGLGGSTDGSTDILVFGSVVDSVTKEECEDSDESSGEVDIEQEASDPEDGRELDPNALLHKASRARNLPVMAEALAHGADINSVSEEDESKSPLIQAVAGVRLNKTWCRIYCEAIFTHKLQVCLFLKRGASQVEVDKDGQDPLSIAVQAANADIVTLLRLARMNEEMREADGPFGQPGQYPSSSPTEQQYRKCIQEFICLSIDEC
uniref:Arf-GAP with coiled-coil, ANK repeat and PH domain-containing protein n=1 Tax=Sinocyclocheilus anshuiensis TaxID=1608454 RepID=A0A671N7Y3_9TELE